METMDKLLLSVPAVVWLVGWGMLEANTLVKVRCRKPCVRCAPDICKGLPLHSVQNASPMAEVRVPLFGQTQLAASTGLMTMAPRTQQAVFAHEMAHLVCRHARLVRWLAFVGMATATLAAGLILLFSDGQWRCVMVLLWFGQWYFLFPLFFLLERQADAGAAALLSGTSPTVTTEAANAVANAVIAIETVNSPLRAGQHTQKLPFGLLKKKLEKEAPIIDQRHAIYHAKMAEKRAARIRALIGQPCGDTAPDRAVRWIWRISFVLLALDIAAVAWLALR